MQVCNNYEARISALIDDELTAGERVEVLEHLAQCPACKAYWEDQLLIRDALRAPESAPAGFADAVMARVRETAQDPCAAPEKKTLRFPGWKRFVGLAACCAVVLLGIWAMEFSPEILRNSADNAAVSNSAAPQMYARDDAALTGNAVETPEADYGASDADTAACDMLPESSAEADDAKTYSEEADCTAVLTTDSTVAETWVEDILGENWVSGESYTLSEEQYSELRKLLEESGEEFNEIMGENYKGSYQLLAE